MHVYDLYGSLMPDYFFVTTKHHESSQHGWKTDCIAFCDVGEDRFKGIAQRLHRPCYGVFNRHSLALAVHAPARGSFPRKPPNLPLRRASLALPATSGIKYFHNFLGFSSDTELTGKGEVCNGQVKPDTSYSDEP